MEEKYLLEIFVEGHVQKVGYRKYIQEEALKYSITGFAKNLEDGRVMIHMISLDKKVLENFLDVVYTGSNGSKVEKIDFKWYLLPVDQNFFVL